MGVSADCGGPIIRPLPTQDFVGKFGGLGKHLEIYHGDLFCPKENETYVFKFHKIEGLIKFCPGCGKKLTRKTILWHSTLVDMTAVEDELRRSVRSGNPV